MKRSLAIWFTVTILVFGMIFPVYAADDTIWSQVGSPFGFTHIYSNPTTVDSLIYVNNTLYAGASDGSGLWDWDGNVWSEIGGPLGSMNMIACLANINGVIYAGIHNSDNIWSWNGKDWSKVAPLGTSGLPIDISCLASINNLLYVGTTDGSGLWVWNGKNWSQLKGTFGSNYTTNIWSLTTINGMLYAGTNFGVWVWDGKTWSQLGSLLNKRTVWSLTNIDNILYAGTDAGLWSWNGKDWSKTTDCPNNTNNIWSLCNVNGALYVGTSNGVWRSTTISFSDISNCWAQKSIEKLVSINAISGYPDGTFKPNSPITRAEFATILDKAFKLEPRQGKVFVDTSNHWAKDTISTSAAYGIVNGYEDNTFRPDNPITREQMATMIVKVAKLKPVSGEVNFTDNKEISSWAQDSVATAVKYSIMNGYSDETFKPTSNATRAEAVTVVINAMDYNSF